MSETLAMKGRERNKPCPCGSGKKLKRCCGTQNYSLKVVADRDGRRKTVPVISRADVEPE
jgi:hypothetical protein